MMHVVGPLLLLVAETERSAQVGIHDTPRPHIDTLFMPGTHETVASRQLFDVRLYETGTHVMTVGVEGPVFSIRVLDEQDFQFACGGRRRASEGIGSVSADGSGTEVERVQGVGSVPRPGTLSSRSRRSPGRKSRVFAILFMLQ